MMETKIKINKKKPFSLENVMFGFITLLILFLPLIFSPVTTVSFLFSKTLPLFAVTFVGLLFIIFKIFKEGRLKFAYHPIVLAAVLISLVYVISGFLALNVPKAFIGVGIETGTVSFVVILFLFAYIVSYFFRGKDKIFISYLAFAVSFVLISIFHILRFVFGADFLSFGLFGNLMSNTIGSFNELAIFSGIAVLLSLISIEFLKLARGFKIFSYIVLVLSIIMLAVCNFPIVLENSFQISLFTIIGLFSLVFFVYFLSSSYEQSTRRVPVASLAVLVLSVIFTFAYGEISQYFSNKLSVSIIEERPTLQETASVSWESLKNKTISGFGPNHFSEGWRLNKSADSNNTNLWDNDIVSGAGNLSSTIVTVGPIGFILWLAFVGFFIYLGVKSLFMKTKDRFSHYLIISSFLISLYLWIVNFIFAPTVVLLTLTFFFSGVFIASLIREEVIKEKTFVFESSKEKTFITVMVLVVAMIGIIFWGYAIGRNFAASYFSNKGSAMLSSAQNIDDLNSAQRYFIQAVSLSKQDSYLRAISSISLAKIQLILQNSNLSQDELRTQFQLNYQDAINAAALAIENNKYNYQNYVAQGNVAESVVSLGVTDAYLTAKSAYEQARKLNPQDPSILLLFARLEFQNKNTDGGTEYIRQALDLKPNYADAFVLLAQNQVTNNNTKAAIETLGAGSLVAPDTNIFFNLGLLHYNNKSYQEAIYALERSVMLSPYYANAKYFLALSYYNSGRVGDAIRQLEDIKSFNSENAEIDSTIQAFKAGQPISPKVSEKNDSSATSSDESKAEDQ